MLVLSLKLITYACIKSCWIHNYGRFWKIIFYNMMYTVITVYLRTQFLHNSKLKIYNKLPSLLFLFLIKYFIPEMKYKCNNILLKCLYKIIIYHFKNVLLLNCYIPTYNCLVITSRCIIIYSKFIGYSREQKKTLLLYFTLWSCIKWIIEFNGKTCDFGNARVKIKLYKSMPTTKSI